jgi:hypothetical protein
MASIYACTIPVSLAVSALVRLLLNRSITCGDAWTVLAKPPTKPEISCRSVRSRQSGYSCRGCVYRSIGAP